MKTLLLVFTLTFTMNSMLGQPESVNYIAISNKFETYYNAEKYDSIFSMFSTEMQSALPLDKTIDFLKGLNSQVGKIQKREFIKYEGTDAIYKTNFDRAILAIHISLDNNDKINGLLINAFKDESLPKIERNITTLLLPFKDEWTVVWGGDTKELNYHVVNNAQKNAFDFVITDAKGNSFMTNGKTNEDYYAFGKNLFAPCDGEIVLVIDGVKENIVGEMNKIDVAGNTVIIKTANNEFLVFCHFKNQTISVKQGQKIKQGDLLGECGNTGHSSEPHLHFNIQNGIDMNSATGIKCYFDKLVVNGQLKTDYSPIQNEKIKP
ncbi:MAG: peptidoglycan DD-metalloendopeptidase family protein [Bacteroidetes bacterium]|nr:peptidoglycan DD-metalloendopeptidase family protein [Bacteroidota bacterium]